jgi:hypothetical protein
MPHNTAFGELSTPLEVLLALLDDFGQRRSNPTKSEDSELYDLFPVVGIPLPVETNRLSQCHLILKKPAVW